MPRFGLRNGVWFCVLLSCSELSVRPRALEARAAVATVKQCHALGVPKLCGDDHVGRRVSQCYPPA